jgi:hypothetical protein
MSRKDGDGGIEQEENEPVADPRAWIKGPAARGKMLAEAPVENA